MKRLKKQLPSKASFSYNPGQNIWQKVKRYNKIDNIYTKI